MMNKSEVGRIRATAAMEIAVMFRLWALIVNYPFNSTLCNECGKLPIAHVGELAHERSESYLL